MSAAEPRLAVDIVVTNHNYGRFLAEALSSACAQTHPEVSVIAVDDGSTDQSRAVLDRFSDRVDVLLKEHGGQASALNAGFERCRGDVLLLLDADDVLRPDAAARVSAAFAADPALAKVQFRMAVMDRDGRRTGAVKPTSHLSPPVGDLRAAELAFPFDLPWLPGGGTAFRAEVVRRLLPIPEGAYPDWGADWYLIHLTALLGSAAAVDEVCAEYRVHGENGYEQERTDLDLGHVRRSIEFARATRPCLEQLADELGLSHPRPIVSTSDVANRLISLTIDPSRHPIATDSRQALLRAAFHSLRLRFDVTGPMKALFAAWFVLQAVAPRGMRRTLAELFLFPERRKSLNGLLARLHVRAGEEALRKFHTDAPADRH
jgi:Glycosyl transferase family 2